MIHTCGVTPERVTQILGLLSYLLRDPETLRIPLDTIERDLGLSRAEIIEDISILNLVNFGGGTYLIYVREEEGQLIIDREPLGENMQYPARLSPTLARSLLLALELVGDVVAPDSAAGLRAKLIEALAGDLQQLPLIETGLVLQPSNVVMNGLATAIRGRRVVQLEYYSAARGSLTFRDIEPELLRSSGQAWYLEAYCRSACGSRTFRVDLIRSARILDETFSPRTKPDAEPGTDPPPLDTGAPDWATLAFDSDRETDLRSWGTPFQKRGDGRFVVETPYFDDEWLVGQVLAALGTAELESPQTLRQDVARAGKALLATYS